MKYRFKHKTEGWTGTIEFHDLYTNMFSSSRCSGTLNFTVESDDQEDPDIKSLNDIVLLSPQEEVEELTEDDFDLNCTSATTKENQYTISEYGRDKLIRIINRCGKGEV